MTGQTKINFSNSKLVQLHERLSQTKQDLLNAQKQLYGVLSKLDDPQTEIGALLTEGQNEIRDLNTYAQKLGTYLDYPYVEQMLNGAAEVSNQ